LQGRYARTVLRRYPHSHCPPLRSDNRWTASCAQGPPTSSHNRQLTRSLTIEATLQSTTKLSIRDGGDTARGSAKQRADARNYTRPDARVRRRREQTESLKPGVSEQKPTRRRSDSARAGRNPSPFPASTVAARAETPARESAAPPARKAQVRRNKNAQGPRQRRQATVPTTSQPQARPEQEK
jgi:hypothetical protein